MAVKRKQAIDVVHTDTQRGVVADNFAINVRVPMQERLKLEAMLIAIVFVIGVGGFVASLLNSPTLLGSIA